MKTAVAPTYSDLICGINVSPETAHGKIEFEEKQIYFCSKNCLETFKRQNNIFDSKPPTESIKKISKLADSMRIDKFRRNPNSFLE